MSKRVLGLIENVVIFGESKVKTQALCDTGAKSTSVDLKIAEKAKLGPIIRTVEIKNPSVKQVFKRPVVKAVIEIAGEKIETSVNIQDRSHMKFPVIIGRNLLMHNFIIDVEKNYELWKNKKIERVLEQKSLEEFK